MMNGLEKSDLAIAAMKPANKAGQPVAERVEPRAGAKGNTDQPRTRRTQSRDSVSPGLARVRDAARQRKKEKFTALLHHVTVDLLQDAFLALKRRAAPGVDGVTWTDYQADLEANPRDRPSVVVVNEGVARSLSTTTLKEDAYAFVTDQQGLVASLSIEGTKITRLRK